MATESIGKLTQETAFEVNSTSKRAGDPNFAGTDLNYR